MKCDNYTKTMLAVIALALTIIALRPDFSGTAAAEVAGMTKYDQKGDYDFKGAVRDIIEDCTVSGEEIDC